MIYPHLGHSDVSGVLYWMTQLFFVQDIASPPKMHLSHNDNMDLVTSPIIVIFIFFPFCKFSMNLQRYCMQTCFFLTFSSEANVVKLCYLALVHNGTVFGTARLCSQNRCKAMGGVFNSPASTQMRMTGIDTKCSSSHPRKIILQWCLQQIQTPGHIQTRGLNANP